MKKLLTCTTATALMLASACAQQPENVSASYVSTANYTQLTCLQLNEEARLLSARIAEVTGQQERAANSDAALTAVTLVLFWPAVFFVGRGDKAAELGRLKGEAEALRSAAIRNGCGAA
jgi:hypothetical protein